MSSSKWTTQPGNILVVDDNEMNRDSLSRRLQRHGYTVVTADCGRRALELLEEQAFDLVLLDIMMPHMNGIEVLSEIRQSLSPLELPVIMATGLSETSDIVRSLETGASDYVTKPLNFPVVLARVQTHLMLKHGNDKLVEVNQRMKKSLDAASAVQRAGLPSEAVAAEGFRFAWRFQPCDEVAGDGLAILPINGRLTAICLWDVCGHGVPAALLSVSISHMLRDSLRNGTADGEDGQLAVASPTLVLQKLNSVFPMERSDSLYFTACFGILDSETGVFNFACAGHACPVLCKQDGTVVRPSSSGFPIGILADLEENVGDYDELKVQLDSGDRLFIFSDGLNEQMDSNGKQFGCADLEEALQTIVFPALDEGLDRLLDRLKDWSEDGSFDDDITVLVAHRT